MKSNLSEATSGGAVTLLNQGVRPGPRRARPPRRRRNPDLLATQRRRPGSGRSGTARRISLVAASGLLWALVPTAPAHAVFGSTACSGFDDPFKRPPDSCVSMGNNFTHTYRFIGVRSDIVLSFQTVAKYQFNDPTELVVTERNLDDADVDVQDNTYGLNNAYGWVNCDPSTATQGGTGTRRWCSGQDLRFNITYETPFGTAARRQEMACHEFGHTVGLRHTTDNTSCMREGEVTGVNSLSQTERNEINNVYNPY